MAAWVDTQHPEKWLEEVEDYTKNVLKEFNKLFSIPISQLFKLSIEPGVFPRKMEIVVVVPIHKKDDTQDLNNYRPIPLLPKISKFFEKLLQNRLSKFPKKNKYLFSRWK